MITCCMSLILSVAFFAVILPSSQSAYAQACQPDTLNITPEATPVSTPQGSIYLNEILFLPVAATLHCVPSTGTITTKTPWIELYNASAQAFQLAHANLDSGPNTSIYNFSLTSIPAHSFIVIFPPTNLFTQVGINSLLRLTINGVVVDQVTIPQLVQDNAYARIPDGNGAWHITEHPTLGESNTITPTVTPTKSTSTPSTHRRTPTATPKTHPSTKKKTVMTHSQNKISSQSSDQNDDQLTNKPQSSQVQKNYPQSKWKDVHIPLSQNNSKPTENPLPPATAEIAQNSVDLPRKIILSLLAIVLTFTIWWCRRLFFKR
ncbi:hypothetical protein [Dictyobacter vulcani]|uniref:hypothetical protein n=1 Tax=Dictyobacter vulcani TaxID=2607529 RepID=UPI00124F98BE|nr:hypothetical protein [Dictyobacter vulcani]